MLKTIKGKVVAVAAAFLLVSGASVAFGASDAGGKLRDWFDQRFAGVTNSVDQNYTGNLNSEINKLNKEVPNLIEGGKANIRNTREASVSEAISTIEGTASEHVESIEGTQEEIENYMDNEFNRLKEEAENKIMKSTGDLKRNSSSQISSQIGTFGTSILNFMEDQLNYTADESLKKVQKAIDDAKAELLVQIANKSGATLEEIKTSINSSIADTRTAISDLTTELVEEQQVLIENKANGMVEDAINEMQNLVDGI
ncbi:hypothetical protein JSQ81_15650 [Sporosarcina sp. Marseille-Q4063]|uniref:hypothetical protein n=1 Tax=Sporosarcina sp. Marseille-Q4063 TaxID=2810514 RepID=UPI001BB0CF6A|nr:hypothetical protein [Sporosarcina sp. Marseille-Q4063]QUW21230.1 hypothetical protein JSQ81_15650 [Sporosarcina sp. Marseille-Q4063]